MNKVYEKGGEPGVAVILNHNNHVLGVITDGDIRRSLLKNIEMSDSVNKIMTKKPITFSYSEDITKSIPIIYQINKRLVI
jgi:CBS domain-containing protein